MKLYKQELKLSYIKVAHDGIRFLQIATYFFYIVPILFTIYLYIMSLASGTSFFAPIVQEPMVTVMFVIAMLNPFFGALIHVTIQDLKKATYVKESLVVLSMIATAQILIGNIFGSAIVWLGVYRQWKYNRTKYESTLEYASDRGGFFKIIGGILLFSLSLICLVLLIKISLH
ncbi:hypothetical protein AAIE21_24380 [Paenibacillus sp. 102]|uniref:hypothetical protein n=1 Tax=Paenibacillus sp. 102 TaxID=3120823 RepID=UPI0031BB5D73